MLSSDNLPHLGHYCGHHRQLPELRAWYLLILQSKAPAGQWNGNEMLRGMYKLTTQIHVSEEGKKNYVIMLGFSTGTREKNDIG